MKYLRLTECHQISGGISNQQEDLLWFTTGASVASFFCLAIAFELGLVHVAAPTLLRATGEVLTLGVSAFTGGYLALMYKNNHSGNDT